MFRQGSPFFKVGLVLTLSMVIALPAAAERIGGYVYNQGEARFVDNVCAHVSCHCSYDTVSGGCAEGDGTDMDDVIRRAEAALYAAKDAGRNRVVGRGALSAPAA
mgnify:CR=1 FL=1